MVVGPHPQPPLNEATLQGPDLNDHVNDMNLGASQEDR